MWAIHSFPSVFGAPKRSPTNLSYLYNVILSKLLLGLLWTMTDARDLRQSVLNEAEPCFHFNPQENLFRMNCSVLNWYHQGYGDNEHISLGPNETFDGGAQNNSVIDLTGIENFQGLVSVSEEVSSIAEAPLIVHVHVVNGITAMNGGFIVRGEQKYFVVDSCSSTGDITNRFAGGICGTHCGKQGEIRILNSYSIGEIRGLVAGGIAGEAVGSHGGFANISRCYSKGTVVGNSAGGIAAGNAGKGGYASIQECYSTGTIAAPGGGGIVGVDAAENGGRLDIENCYTRGDILENHAGGITGGRAGGQGQCCSAPLASLSATGTIYLTNTYASGVVEYQSAGGLIGSVRPEFGGAIQVTFSVYNSKNGAEIIGDSKQLGDNFTARGVSGNLNGIKGRLYRYNDSIRWDDHIWSFDRTDGLPILRFRAPGHRVIPTPSPTPGTPTPSTFDTIGQSNRASRSKEVQVGGRKMKVPVTRVQCQQEWQEESR